MTNKETERIELSVTAYPCSGRGDQGIPRGHVYDIQVGGQSMGFLSLEHVQSTYPNATVSNSDVVCPTCAADIRSRM